MATITIQAPAPSWEGFPLDPKAEAAAVPTAPALPTDWNVFPEVKAPATPSAPKGFVESAVNAAQQLYPGYLSQQQAASQRTTPVISAQAPNFLGPATGDEETGALGYKNDQGQFVPTDINKHVALTDPATGVTNVYARTPQTNESMAVSTGRMISTMFGPGDIGFAREVPAAIQAAQRLGIDVPRAITSESPLVQFAGQGIAKSPGGGPLLEAIPASVKQLGSKVGEAAEMTGGVAEPAGAGAGFKEGVTNYFEPTATKRINEAYGEINKLIDPNATSPLTNTSRLVDALNAARSARGKPPSPAVGIVQPALEMKPALPSGTMTAEQYQNFLRGQGQSTGLTFEAIKNLRTDVGEAIVKTPEGTSLTELKRLYKALSQDLEAHVRQTGGPQAQVAFERANVMNKTVEGWREILAPILGGDVKSGESIAEALLRKAGTGPQGDIRALTIARGAVPKEAWQNIAATAISRLGRSRNGEWTPAAFLNDYRHLSDQGKRLLFGSVGSGNVIPFLSDIADVSQQFVKAGKVANVSGTSGHEAFRTAILTISGGLAATPALGLKALIAPATAIGAILGNNIMARVLATPSTAASMARFARVYQAVAASPTPAGMAAFQRTSGELANTINGAFGTKVSPQQIMRSTVQGPGTSQAGENQDNIRRPGNQ